MPAIMLLRTLDEGLGLKRKKPPPPTKLSQAQEAEVKKLLNEAEGARQAKKLDESQDRWQARVNDDWRFYFKIERDIYRIIDLIPHPK